MPVYEYYCQACDHEWEREQRISDAPVKTCPKCRARKAKRLISRTSFVLKGSGWYSDLYASPKGDAGAKADEPSKGDAADGAKADAGDGGKKKPKKQAKEKGKGEGSGGKSGGGGEKSSSGSQAAA